MKIDLTGQTAAITGAASGIGLAIAKAFIDAGAGVLALDRNENALAELASDHGDQVIPHAVNICDESALRSIANETEIDHLICCAAIGSGKSGFPFWKMEPDDWRPVIEVTLMGTINTVLAFTPSLLKGETQNKSILLLSSVAGQIGSQTDPPYSASKAAIINFAQCATKDFASYGIRVNALSPGMVKTELNQSVFEANKKSSDQTYDDWAGAKIAQLAPLGRWQMPEEFGAMAVFLASRHGKNITGQTLNVDGGQVMHS